MRDKCFAAFDERGKKLRSIDQGHPWDAIERVRLEDIDSGIDRVAGDLVRVGLLQKPLDVALSVGFHQPVGARVFDRRQDDGGLRLALPVQGDHGVEIHVSQDVAVEHHDGLVERLASVADRACGAERFRLDDADGETRLRAVAENLLDSAGLVVETEDRLIDSGHLLQQIELIVQEGRSKIGTMGLGV